MKLRPKELIFACIISGSVIVFLEFGLTVIGIVSPTIGERLAKHPAVSPIIPDEKLGHRPNPAYPGHDSNGFRNPAVPTNAEIVTLGDSQTYGVGVESQVAWPRQLESMIHTSVYSIAFGGYGPAHYLILMKEAFKFNPSIIIASFYSGNDLFDSFDFVYNQKKLLELKNPDIGVQRSITEAEELESIQRRVVRLFDQTWRNSGVSSEKNSVVREFISKYSKLYGLARWAKREMSQHVHSDAWASAKAFAEKNPACCEVLDHNPFGTVLTPEYRLSALDLTDVRIAEGYRISLEAIKQMHLFANKGGIRFLVVLIPTKELVFNTLASNPSPTYLTLVKNEARLWKNTKDFLQRHRVAYVDALPALRAQLSLGTQPYPVSSNGHPNEYGHTAIARTIQVQIKK